MMGMEFTAPYDMQTGSGTFDLKPSLTYNAPGGDSAWNWGAQGTYVWRMGKNRNDYSLGNVFKATGWLQRAFGPAASWLRLAYGDTGRIKGSDPGIDKILAEFPDRAFDTGICEAHTVAFAAGMAKAGMRPIVDIYSTFLQRSYDQIFQEVALQNLPVTLMLDRAGVVGPDGPTHHGVLSFRPNGSKMLNRVMEYSHQSFSLTIEA